VSMTEEEAVRYVRAALRLMWDRIPATSTELRKMVAEFGKEMDGAFGDVLFTPWADEPAGPAEDRMWQEIAEGDWVRGGDGAYYLVKANRSENGKAYVTIQVKGQDRTYPREPEVMVATKRGPVGLAVDTLAAAGLDPVVLASG
jgi:hypothetical protein